MPSGLTPLFIRLPRAQAALLDGLAAQSGRSKQHLVSELVAQGLSPGAHMSPGRVEVSTRTTPGSGDEVLTLEEAATLLKLPPDAIRDRAEHGDLPARRFRHEWRFSRAAVLDWLEHGDAPRTKRRR
jgi:excisionase family DNA binding protein